MLTGQSLRLLRSGAVSIALAPHPGLIVSTFSLCPFSKPCRDLTRGAVVTSGDQVHAPDSFDPCFL